MPRGIQPAEGEIRRHLFLHRTDIHAYRYGFNQEHPNEGFRAFPRPRIHRQRKGGSFSRASFQLARGEMEEYAR